MNVFFSSSRVQLPASAVSGLSESTCVERTLFLLLLDRHLLSLTMSLLCCFSFRDYGSKRKSGKSPVFPSLSIPKDHSLFQPVAPNRASPWDLRGLWFCMTYDSLCVLSVIHVMPVCGVFTCPAAGRWLAVGCVLGGVQRAVNPPPSGCRFAIQGGVSELPGDVKI